VVRRQSAYGDRCAHTRALNFLPELRCSWHTLLVCLSVCDNHVSVVDTRRSGVGADDTLLKTTPAPHDLPEGTAV